MIGYKQDAILDLHLEILRNDVMRKSPMLTRQDFQETLGDKIVAAQYVMSRRAKRVKNRSLIKIGQQGNVYELESAAFTSVKGTIALMARKLGSLEGFSRLTIYTDGKYPFLAGGNRDINDDNKYREKLRDIRKGYVIGSSDRASMTRMMANVIKAYKGSVNTTRHQLIMGAASGKMSYI